MVATGGTNGIFPPLAKMFENEFGEVVVINRWLPNFYRLLLAGRSLCLPKENWRRKWMHHCEKTPFSFRKRTQVVGKEIAKLGEFDFVVSFGVLHGLGIECKKPFFIFADSTRRLSMTNEHDEVSHFRDEAMQMQWLALEAEVYTRANAIFVGNERVRESLVMDYGVDEARVITSGFGAGLNAAEMCEKRIDGKTVLFIGKGDFRKKGGVVLMEAFQEVRERIPDAILHIVGQPTIPDQDGVINHGFISDREKLKELMMQASAFVLPSLVDRNPLTTIEAMAASTPCIVSDYGAMPEIVGDAGLIVQQGNVRQLSDAIVRLLTDNELARRLGENGRARYENQYNWGVIWPRISARVRTELGMEHR